LKFAAALLLYRQEPKTCSLLLFTRLLFSTMTIMFIASTLFFFTLQTLLSLLWCVWWIISTVVPPLFWLLVSAARLAAPHVGHFLVEAGRVCLRIDYEVILFEYQATRYLLHRLFHFLLWGLESFFLLPFVRELFVVGAVLFLCRHRAVMVKHIRVHQR
jgi:hypothetical protein